MPELRTIPLAEIDEPPLPVRQSMDDEKLAELAASIRDIGLQNPITVIPDNGRFQVVTGHRRLLAVKMNNAHDVLCIVRAPEETQEIAAMIAENACREDVNPADEALFLARLVDEGGYTEEKLLDLTRRSRDYIGDRFRLLRGDPVVFAALQRGDINLAHARELNKCEDEGMRRYFLDATIRGGQSSRYVRRWIDEWRANAAPATSLAAPAPAPVADQPVVPHVPECACCGGTKDPWNLVTVTIHKWEWEQLMRAMQEAARAG